MNAAEVGLRNTIIQRLTPLYGQEWWDTTAFHDLVGPQTKGILLRSRNKRHRSKGFVTPGCMAAELTFGFWSKMLLPTYEQRLWTPLSTYFPGVPQPVGYPGFAARCEEVCTLRNRIFHHEPIFDRDISNDYSKCLEFIGWLSADKVTWVKSFCRVPAVIRQKP